MPSEKVLEQKKQIVADLTEKLQAACTGVVVDYKGTNVTDDTALRKELREAGVQYTVVKNTLLGLAAENAGLGEMKSVLEGTTAIALSNEDYTAAARILLLSFNFVYRPFGKEELFVKTAILGFFMQIDGLAELSCPFLLWQTTVINCANSRDFFH